MDFKTAVANEILSAMKAGFPEAELPEVETVAAALEVPPDTALGDYAFPCFKLSKALRKSPMLIADALSENIHADFLGKVDFFKGEVKDGRIFFPAMDGQSIPYEGPRTGRVDVAIRPENLSFTEDGVLHGVLETQYYLGDVDDCRVRIGETVVRVITNGYEYNRLRDGQQVSLGVRDLMVFEDNGYLERMLEINT